MTETLLVAGLAYLLGSIPFGMVVAKVMGLGNLRDIGSGNIGATNVLRTGNKLAAVLTLIFDAGKGAVAVIIARIMFGEAAAQIAALASFIGHCYPIWLKFKGGKGCRNIFGHLVGAVLACGDCRLLDVARRCCGWPHIIACGTGFQRDIHCMDLDIWHVQCRCVNGDFSGSDLDPTQ